MQHEWKLAKERFLNAYDRLNPTEDQWDEMNRVVDEKVGRWKDISDQQLIDWFERMTVLLATTPEAVLYPDVRREDL